MDLYILVNFCRIFLDIFWIFILLNDFLESLFKIFGCEELVDIIIIVLFGSL